MTRWRHLISNWVGQSRQPLLCIVRDGWYERRCKWAGTMAEGAAGSVLLRNDADGVVRRCSDAKGSRWSCQKRSGLPAEGTRAWIWGSIPAGVAAGQQVGAGGTTPVGDGRSCVEVE